MSRRLQIAGYAWITFVALWVLVGRATGTFETWSPRDPMSYVKGFFVVLPAILVWQVAARIDRKRKP